MRINQIGRRKRGTAFFTLIAIGVFVAALWAGTYDVTVSQKLINLFVIVLIGLLLDEFTLVIHFFKKGRSGFMMRFAAGARVDAKRNPKVNERLLHDFVVLVNDLLRRHTFFACFDRNRHTVFIAAANKKHIALIGTKVTHVNIARQIASG